MPLVVCYKCKKSVDIKRTALCSVCNNRFEPDCDGYPEQAYRLMNKESKNKWRCKACTRKKTVNSAEPSNITVRKTPTYPTSHTEKTCIQANTKQSSPDQDSHILTDYDTSYEIEATPSKLSRTVDGTTTNISSIPDMQDTIAQLTMKLESSENELETTILKNNDLRKQINKLSQEINLLKSLCSSSTSKKKSSPLCNEKKKRHSRLSQIVSSTPLHHPPLSSPRITTNVKCHTNVVYLHLLQNISALQRELQVAENEIKTLNIQKQTLQESLMTTPKPQQISPAKIDTTIRTSSNTQIFEKTIRIFGAQQCVGLAAALTISRKKTQYEKYGVLAHTMPNAQSDTITKSCINTHLQLGDKIVISLGENDDNVGHVLSQLKIILKTFCNNTVFILNVLNNSYLDVNKLNNLMKNICKYYKNCHFMDYIHHSVPNICELITYIIDCEYYDKTYLNPAQKTSRE
ncbi:hypothetical protein HF086_005832 [Spodoptera exigua]|uniref:Uncharacterized protein n=1 Tax=Spodoptera exigua TaxID=7107 RepID=A0A922S8W9_SPOEX|nr:hypothetical protein HF086_005832 [Spodoptera exigua]